jgi:hypothetical protein
MVPNYIDKQLAGARGVNRPISSPAKSKNSEVTGPVRLSRSPPAVPEGEEEICGFFKHPLRKPSYKAFNFRETPLQKFTV